MMRGQGTAFRTAFREQRGRKRTSLPGSLLSVNPFRFFVLCILLTSLGSYWLFPGLFGRQRENEAISPFCRRPSPLVCAHGGDTTAGAIANTMPAYRAALQNGYTCVEIDVSQSKDFELVVLHPRQLKQISGGEWERLKWYGIEGGDSLGVLTLEEALTALSGRGLSAIILDIKDQAPGPSPSIILKAAESIQRTQCKECFLWAKNDTAVAELKDLGMGPRSGFVVMNQTAESRETHMDDVSRIKGAALVAAFYGMLDGAFVDRAERLGLRVFGWTANEALMIEQVLASGAHGVISDFPDKVRAAVRSKRQDCGLAPAGNDGGARAGAQDRVPVLADGAGGRERVGGDGSGAGGGREGSAAAGGRGGDRDLLAARGSRPARLQQQRQPPAGGALKTAGGGSAGGLPRQRRRQQEDGVPLGGEAQQRESGAQGQQVGSEQQARGGGVKPRLQRKHPAAGVSSKNRGAGGGGGTR